VDAATSGGSGPLVVFTQARIDALRMTADDELTLLTRDSQPGLQPDYQATVNRLHRLLGSAGAAGVAEQNEIVQAQGALAGYGRVHAQIRQLDATGTATGEQDADGLAASQLPAASSTLDGDLAHSIATSQQAFDQSMSGATSDTASLIWASAILSLLVADAGSRRPVAVARRLTTAALDAGGRDNITVAVVPVGRAEPPSWSTPSTEE